MKLAVLCSLLLSILHSILFYGQKWGISIFLFTTVGLFLLIQILEKNKKIKNKKALLLSIPIILLSTTYFIFNNSFFNFFNIIVILLLFGIMTIMAILGELNIHNIMENLFILFFGPIEEVGQSTREICKCFSQKQGKEKDKRFQQIGKAILYSFPLLILVLILLITADEIFASIFHYIFSTLFHFVNITSIYHLIFRVFIILALMLYFIGVIVKIKEDELNNEESSKDNKIRIQATTLNTLLTLLNIVYFVFSITQGIYLIQQVNSTTIVNYAQYARTGFFQLMAVSIINFIVILVVKNNKQEISNKKKRYAKIMNVLLAIFTIIILISSIIRMNLYEREYGYTFLRLMVYVIQITELILIIPTIVYIIKEKFPILKWYMIITISMYIVVNFVNIDYIIAKGNIDRYFEAKEKKNNRIDFSYIEQKTGTDALPEVMRLLEVDDKLLKVKVNHYLLEEYKNLKEEKGTFQEFNLSKMRAKRKLEKLSLSYIATSEY